MLVLHRMEALVELPGVGRKTANVVLGHALGVPGLAVVEGAVPDALAGLPAPNAVFVGGGATGAGVLDLCAAALKPGGRLVVNAVTIETKAVLIARFRRDGGALTTLGKLAISLPAAYAFARMRFRGREAIFAMVLGTMIVPGVVTIVVLSTGTTSSPLARPGCVPGASLSLPTQTLGAPVDGAQRLFPRRPVRGPPDPS